MRNLTSSDKKLIFYSHAISSEQILSGSSLRPVKMYTALQEKNGETILLAGESNKRLKKWKSICVEDVLGVYAELSTMPVALTDVDHFPRHPFADMDNFRRFHEAGIPVMVFYRDVHWRFPQYNERVPFFKRIVAKFCYYLELYQISRSVTHLFVPSLRMLEHFPIRLPRERISSLPPGSEIREASDRQFDKLELFYVGGVLPPLYDLSPMFLALAHVPDASLTVCCREWEWHQVKGEYCVPSNVTIIHESGRDLDDRFAAANAFLMFWEISEYLRFSMPVKLFEALGAGLPVITNANSEMGDFVEHENIGWALNDVNELTDLLSYLADDLTAVRETEKHASNIRWSHTWEARAEEVLDTLDRYKEMGRP